MNPFQQSQQMLLQQQYPFDRVLPHAIVDPNHARVMGVQMSTNMAPFYQLVIAHAINEIQSKRQANLTRAFFFNVMAEGGFTNHQFIPFASELARVIETIVMHSGRPVQEVIPEATVAFTTYSVAKLAMTNQLLLQAVHHQNSQTIERMQVTIQQFEATFRNMVQPQNNQTAFGAYNNAPAGNGLFSGASFSQSNNQQPFNFLNTTPSAAPPNNAPFFPSSEPTNTRADGFQASLPASAFKFEPIQSEVSASVFTSGGETSTAVAKPTPAARADKTLSGVADTLEGWTPSKDYPSLPTYDPNREQLKLHIYSGGVVQPVIAPNPVMDRNAHLKPLSITPNWVTMSAVRQAPVLEDGRKQTPAEPSLREQDIQVIDAPDMAEVVTSTRQAWLKTEANLVQNIKRFPERTLMSRQYFTVCETLIASPAVEQTIYALRNADSVAKAAEILYAAHMSAVSKAQHRDVRSFQRLIARMTSEVNRFVRLDMSLNFGTIDDIVEDGRELVSFIAGALGEGAGERLDASYKDIAMYALDVADDEFGLGITAQEFDKCPLEGANDKLIHLISHRSYNCVDLVSPQLQAEIPKKGFSVTVNESSTPLLAHLAKQCMDRKAAQDKGGPGFDPYRFLMATRDGVRIEFGYGAFATNSIVAAVYREE